MHRHPSNGGKYGDKALNLESTNSFTVDGKPMHFLEKILI